MRTKVSALSYVHMPPGLLDAHHTTLDDDTDYFSCATKTTLSDI